MKHHPIRVYADVENALGMPPETLNSHVRENIGRTNSNFAFLAKRNQSALIEEWKQAGFQVCLTGAGSDAADHRLISTVIRDIQRDREKGRKPGTIVLVATGDGVHQEVLKLAGELGWKTVVIGWGRVSKKLKRASHSSTDLSATYVT